MHSYTTRTLYPYLGETRTVLQSDHAFLAPDGHVLTTLPEWHAASVIVLITPQMGARFQQYMVLMDEGGHGKAPQEGLERFIFTLEGHITLRVENTDFELGPYGYAFLPADCPHEIKAPHRARVTVFERRFISAGTGVPELIVGSEHDLQGEPFMDDPDLICRKLLPDDEAFDMAVNTMTFAPGTPLPFAETHVMEHGMLMLEGGGVYRLNQAWYPITAGDTLWMGPYCPQWFAAVGKTPAKYLLYKECNRDAFRFEKES